MSGEFVIVEKEPDAVPDHWTSLGVLEDGRRVMKKYSTEEKAEKYLDKMYGMYRNDAEVKSVAELDIDLE